MICQMFSKNRRFPRFHGVIKMMNQISLVLEFIGDKTTGRPHTLDKVLSRRNPKVLLPTKTETVGIADDIVQAVSALHKKGILHNDIKMNNIILEKRMKVWRAVLIDFGEATSFAVPLVKSSSIETRMLYTEGLKYYSVAPEVLLKQEPTSVQSDIYSVGMIFKELGEKSGIDELTFLGEICSDELPYKRPETMKRVAVKLGHIKTKVEIEAENNK